MKIWGQLLISPYLTSQAFFKRKEKGELKTTKRFVVHSGTWFNPLSSCVRFHVSDCHKITVGCLVISASFMHWCIGPIYVIILLNESFIINIIHPPASVPAHYHCSRHPKMAPISPLGSINQPIGLCSAGTTISRESQRSFWHDGSSAARWSPIAGSRMGRKSLSRITAGAGSGFIG